jgi:ABC-type transporter Mla MlaB component
MNGAMHADMRAEASTHANAAAPVQTLPAELTIFSAAETREQLLAWLARRAPDGSPADLLPLDASGVVDVDGAGVQLLCALGRQADRDARAWQIVAPSGALQRACRVLGLGDWLSQHTARA